MKAPRMNNLRRIVIYVAWAALVLVGTHRLTHAQGELHPPGPPEPTMYSLQEIYKQVDAVWMETFVISNTLAYLDYTTGAILKNTIVLTNVVSGVDWVTISALPVHLEALTNALGGVDWQDIRDIGATVENIEQNVSALTNMFDSAESNIAAIASNTEVMVESLAVIESRTSTTTNVLAAMKLDLEAIRLTVEENNAMLHSLTNSP